LLSGAENVQAGNSQVAVIAIAFTTTFVIVVALAAAAPLLGYGRKANGSRRAAGGAKQARAERKARSLPREHRKFGVSHRRGRLTVEVNPRKCARFGFCEHEAPDVFYLESDGRFGYQASVPVARMDQVISAMDICPTRAIKVKLPSKVAQSMVRPDEPPEDPGRTIIPIFSERPPEDDRLPSRA